MYHRKLFGFLGLALLPSQAVAEDPLKVELITAKRVPVAHELSLVGSVEATDSFPAAFRNGGQISFLDAEVGRSFEPGEVIARIDPTNVQAALDAAEANRHAAEAALVQAEQARDRTQSMLQRGVGTQAQFDAAEQSYLEAEARRDQADALLETARQAVEDAVLTAEREVIVTERFVDFGEIVAAGTAVVQLAPKDERQAVFLAPDAAGLSNTRGQEVTLDPSGSVPPFKTEVTEVLPVLSDTGTVEIHADIPQELTKRIPIGTPITGRAPLVTDAQISLPWTVLNSTADGPAVWVVDPGNNTVALRPVTISLYANETVAISDGLEEGEIVVGAGSHLLFDGRTVAAAEAAK